MTLLRTLLLATVFMTLSSMAQACIIGHPFNLEDLDAAPVVFEGDVIDYLAEEPNRVSYAEITFRINDAFRGEAPAILKVVWQNSTYGYPEDLQQFLELYGERLVVGLDLRFQRPQVFQVPCHPPFMFSHHEMALRMFGSPEEAERLRAELQQRGWLAEE